MLRTSSTKHRFFTFVFASSMVFFVLLAIPRSARCDHYVINYVINYVIIM